MLDAQQAAEKMAVAFYELTLARGVMALSVDPLQMIREPGRRVTVLARIFLPLRDNAEFKTAYAREMAALRRQAAVGGNEAKSPSGSRARRSSLPL
jgi:hypothetical protein